jgi:hypothetical protein
MTLTPFVEGAIGTYKRLRAYDIDTLYKECEKIVEAYDVSAKESHSAQATASSRKRAPTTPVSSVDADGFTLITAKPAKKGRHPLPPSTQTAMFDDADEFFCPDDTPVLPSLPQAIPNFYRHQRQKRQLDGKQF